MQARDFRVFRLWGASASVMVFSGFSGSGHFSSVQCARARPRRDATRCVELDVDHLPIVAFSGVSSCSEFSLLSLDKETRTSGSIRRNFSPLVTSRN